MDPFQDHDQLLSNRRRNVRYRLNISAWWLNRPYALSLPIPRKISLPAPALYTDFFTRATLLRRALRHDAAALFAAFRTEINNPIGIPDHIQIVLDDDDRIAQVGQPVEHVEQLFYIIEVQPGRRLVQQV